MTFTCLLIIDREEYTVEHLALDRPRNDGDARPSLQQSNHDDAPFARKTIDACLHGPYRHKAHDGTDAQMLKANHVIGKRTPI